MTGFFSPNLQVLSDWRSTVKVAFQKLAKTSYVTDSTFEWQTFDPQTDFSGMTITNYSLLHSRYLKINKLLFISCYFTVTLAAPLATTIYVTIPGTAPIPKIAGDLQSGPFLLDTGGGVATTGRWYLNGNGGKLLVQQSAGTPYVAGGTVISIQASMEIQ